MGGVTSPHPETERYYTPKLSLLAPAVDDEISAMRDNWDRLEEAYAGAIIVNPGTMPDETILYDGCIVAEKVTGIVWRAQRNASGVFEKRYTKYPWRACFTQVLDAGAAGPGQWTPWGWTTVDNNCVNAGAADLVDFRLVIPVTGIYVGSDFLKWQAGGPAAGARALGIVINDQFGGVIDAPAYEYVAVPNNIANSATTCSVPFCRKFNKGDRVCGMMWQNSGTNINTYHEINIELIKAVG